MVCSGGYHGLRFRTRLSVSQVVSVGGITEHTAKDARKGKCAVKTGQKGLTPPKVLHSPLKGTILRRK